MIIKALIGRDIYENATYPVYNGYDLLYSGSSGSSILRNMTQFDGSYKKN